MSQAAVEGAVGGDPATLDFYTREAAAYADYAAHEAAAGFRLVSCEAELSTGYEGQPARALHLLARRG